MRLRFCIRKSRTNSQGMCPIDCRIRIDGIQATPFSTHIMVLPAKWDSKAQRIKGASESVLEQNRKLDNIKYELDQIYNVHRAKGILLSARELSDIYHGKKEIGCTLSQLLKKKIEQLKMLSRSKGTLEIHERAHGHLLAFVKDDLQVNEIEKRHIQGFWAYLKNKKYDHDYVNKIISNCKSAFIYGENEGLLERNPFKGLRLVWENKIDLTCLEEWEMTELKTKSWSPKLQRIVDSFIFMCYQGLHISDYRKLTVSNISSIKKVEWIRVGRTKTKVEAMVPLHSEAKKLIEKYGDLQSMPRLTGKTCNEYLKIVAESIGTQKNLTNKVARKTFTDMCLNEYIMSEESVAAMLGHKSTRFVKKYGSVRQSRIYAEWKDKIA